MLYPEFEELLQLGYRASKLNLASKRPVLSTISGDHRSPFRGRGLEFEEVREYAYGDDVRNIDWRVTARTGKPHLKLFSEERERSVLICNDINSTMRFGTRGTFKSIQAARAAAVLGWAASRENNRIGGSFYGNVEGGQMFIDPSRSRKAMWRMLKQLCDTNDYHAAPVLLEDHLRYLSKAVPAGALVFILSDFLSSTKNLKKALGDLHRHADVVLVSINDPADEYLPPVGPIVFTDDTREKLIVNTADKHGNQAYQKRFEKNREALQAIMNALGLGFVSLSTDRDVLSDLIGGMKRLRRKGGASYAKRFAIGTA